MGSQDSFIRSAAQATSSAYRRLPIRWRLAGSSAALTLIILLCFATGVGALTTRSLWDDFHKKTTAGATAVERKLTQAVKKDPENWRMAVTEVVRSYDDTPVVGGYDVAARVAIRVVDPAGRTVAAGGSRAPDFPFHDKTTEYAGWEVQARRLQVERPPQSLRMQYATALTGVRSNAAGLRFLLGMGVVGGAVLALLAGLATAQRAMAPIAELTSTARRVAAARDPSIRIPRPEADDEVAELSRTLEEMLAALDQSRSETEAALSRQREFVADASHELRTPLTAVLANLELLEQILQDEPREAAHSALRSARRMRRLVGDLLLLARADAGRLSRHERLDLSAVLTDAAEELQALAGGHRLLVQAEPGATVSGTRDDLHRLTLNLLENALRHTATGTAVEATVKRFDGHVLLAVEDDGPGIPLELRSKIFERFFRGAGDRSGSSGLGLAIVRAVTESHRGSVTLEDPLDGRGARFVVKLPAA